MEKMKLDIQRFAVSVQFTNIEETDINIADNTSKLKFDIEIITSGATYNNSGTAYYKVTIKRNSDNVQIYDSGKKKFNISKNTTKDFTLTTTAIEHESDGSYSSTLKCTLYVYLTSTTDRTVNQNTSLSTIPRASTITSSVNTLTLGGSVDFTITRADNNFTHTLRYGDTHTGTIASDVGTSYTWTTPTNLLPDKMSEAVIVYCDTIYNNEVIGTSSVTITMNTPSYVPSISLSIYDLNPITRAWGVYVRRQSGMEVTITGASAYGGSISKYAMRMSNSGEYTEFNDNILYPDVNSNEVIYAKVIDSRGQSNTIDTIYFYADYDMPKIMTYSVQRCDISGNIDDNGNYCFINFNASISSCRDHNKTNTVYKIRYKLKSASTYTDVTVGSNANSINYAQVLEDENNQKIQFSTSNEYDFQFYVKDTLSSAVTVDQSIDTGFDLLNFNPSGKSMAIGKVSAASANQELLEVALQTTFLEQVDADVLNFNSSSYHDSTKQDTLVSGTNIKTINNASLLGSGNIDTTPTTNILKASASSDVSISATGYNKLTLINNDFQNGTNLSIDSGGIKIGTGITKIKVSGVIYYSGGTEAGDSLRIAIFKNNENDPVAQYIARAGTTGTYESRNIAPTPISVQQNDVIYLYYSNSTSARGNISSDSNSTYLVVEQIL